jgi:nucleoid DNA-binding protein
MPISSKDTLVSLISKDTGLSEKTVRDVLTALSSAVAQVLKEHKKVTLYGLAVCEIKKAADMSTIGRPMTRSVIQIRPTATFKKNVLS